uniref:Putative monocarboxylate transporter n=1 Tax=Xenopsylla cheopis TaxID=163159 RepID=A0A6M2DZK4_XENCH
MAGGLLAGICLVVSMFAQDVITLLFTIGIGTGLGFGLIYLPAIVSVTMYFERYRSLATGIAVCGAGFGTIVFPPLTEILMQEYGWRGTTLLMGGFVLNCIFFGALFRPLEYPKKEPIEAFPAKKKFEIPRSNSAGHSMDSRKTETMRLAQSQPSSLDSIHSKKASVSAFHRKDVFYQGSLIKLAERQSRSTIPDELKLLDKSGSFIRENLRRPSSISRHMMVQETRRKKLCADVDIETIKEMMNYALFKDPVFIIFLLSNFATSVGYQVPYVYIVPQSNLIGLTGDQGSYLLSVLGIANTVGRIVLGYLSDKTWVNRLLVYEMCLIVSGLATALTTLCFNFTTMALCASVYGFSIGAYVGLTSVILVDLLGLDKLTNAFGLLLLFQGIASLIGPPLIGFIFDITQSYQGGFFSGRRLHCSQWRRPISNTTSAEDARKKRKEITCIRTCWSFMNVKYFY